MDADYQRFLAAQLPIGIQEVQEGAPPGPPPLLHEEGPGVTPSMVTRESRVGST